MFGVCDRLLDDGVCEAVVVVHHANTTGMRTAGSWIFEGWPSTIIRLDVVPGIATHRLVTFEKIRAPGSSLLGQQLRIHPTDTGYQAITATVTTGGAGELLASIVVAEAGGQLYRQQLIERLMERAHCRERAAAKYLGKAVQAGLLRSIPSGQQVIYQSVDLIPEVEA